MKRSFTMFPQVMTVVGSYMHPVGQAAGRPICWIEHASRICLLHWTLRLRLDLMDSADIFLCNGQGFVF